MSTGLHVVPGSVGHVAHYLKPLSDFLFHTDPVQVFTNTLSLFEVELFWVVKPCSLQ